MESELMDPAISQELEKAREDCVTKASLAVILTRGDYDKWGEYGKQVSRLEKEIELWFDGTDDEPGPLALAHKAWKRLTEKKREALGPLLEAKRLLSGKLAEWWRHDQERIARERREAEEKARKEEAARMKEEGAPKSEVKAVLKGETPIQSPPMEMPKQTAGLAKRETYSAEVTDFMALVRAVAAGREKPEALKPDMAYLNGQARLQKKSFSIPGCRVVLTSGTVFK